ncbi:hypothetical protein RB196_16005 [Streptomyces sp. PmtA]|uniref:hypothetical protein n=1 Tax=Streptomyces sp. PmtA TaxID=3074275 RepID=UPI0030151373
MSLGPVPPAKWLSRELDEPHETDLGGEARHHQFATAYVLMVCDRRDASGRYMLLAGSVLPEEDLYAFARRYPLTWKAEWLLDWRGQPEPLPEYLSPDERRYVEEAQAAARYVRTEAHRRGVVV